MTTTAAPRRNALDRVVLVTRTVLALAFLTSGTLMLTGVIAMGDLFAEIGAPPWLRPTLGALQIAGGLGLLVPVLSGAAAIGLALMMVGATVAELRVGGSPVAALAVLATTAALAVALRARTLQLLRSVRPGTHDHRARRST
ncbi:DoxX family protein [Isoptericola sp. 4D.3]|uniref:DoxX family protein n=1 Tax=Isoptericola peretonis TaxID=2918523 RepID=A0ABT0J4H5_9MICO|nr:DoxX family protein [Isoptericola sp. 4D.3]